MNTPPSSPKKSKPYTPYMGSCYTCVDCPQFIEDADAANAYTCANCGCLKRKHRRLGSENLATGEVRYDSIPKPSMEQDSPAVSSSTSVSSNQTASLNRSLIFNTTMEALQQRRNASHLVAATAGLRIPPTRDTVLLKRPKGNKKTVGVVIIPCLVIAPNFNDLCDNPVTLAERISTGTIARLKDVPYASGNDFDIVIKTSSVGERMCAKGQWFIYYWLGGEKIEQLEFSDYSSQNYPSSEIIAAMVGKGTGKTVVVSGSIRDEEECDGTYAVTGTKRKRRYFEGEENKEGHDEEQEE